MSLTYSLITPPRSTFAVSVVIPMYNVDKYVGECLDSLLAQTFQDFDVIVVDDCSTDNSLEIVKSYESKFSGRLTIAQTEKNSGGAGEPRNMGIERSTGEYISFIDPDDTIMPNTLEEMYKAAKKFDADVVHCEKWYGIPDEFYNDAEYRKNVKPTVHPSDERIFTTKPTLLTNDIEKRVKDFCQKRWLTWSVCLQMVRRDFMFENEIRFANVYAEDMIFTMCEICCAKNYLVMPNTFYLYRLRNDSSVKGHINLSVTEIIHKYVLTLKNGINYLDKFLSAREFFSHRPNLKYVLFNAFMNEIIYLLKKAYDESPPYDIDELLRKELDDNSAFTAFLFNNTYRLKSALNQKRISVIIPMYNAEKYIGECLDSLLDQTFQDFEVIVIDDCSTDSSIQVVNGYGTRFNGRLKLTKTEKNTGSPGEPGNLGVALSRGEYLFIMDNDDTITPDALEKLYNTAKKFDADVVACDKYYWVPEKSWDDVEFRKNLEPHGYQRGGPVEEPTLLPFNIPQRVQDCYDRKFLWELWTKLIRRDFLIENDIRFTKNIIQDFLATCCMAYTAKKFVRVPYAVNFYRIRENSLYHRKRKPLQQLETYLSSLKFGFKYLDEFLSKREFFQKNPATKRIALSTYLKEIWELYIQKIYHEVPASDRNKVLREIFTDDDQTILTEFFFYALEDFTKINAESQIMYKFSRYFTARIDFKFWSTAGDFQLLSVSDNKAEVLKPDWFQKDGVGYVIMSYAGKVEFVVKATADGRVNFNLMGIWVQNPEDNSKLIPYWIDYTKLTINGKTIFDKITPAWHNQPYVYAMYTKANEEIKVQFEWLPHSGDLLPEASKIQVKPLVDKFLPYLTGRVDFKFWSTEGDFQLLSVSDDRAEVLKPDWFQKDGVGYVIMSYAGKVEFVAKTTANGRVSFEFRGIWVQDPEDNSKLIPYWIDYTKLTINGKTIFDKITSAWHDQPYVYFIDANANEEIKVQFEWLPHRGDILPDKTVEKSLVDKFPPYVTSRMDVKLQSTEGDFQILSMSDDNASVKKPTWLQKNGVGYQIQSYAGKMEFVAKANAGGKINLALLGLDVRDPKDNSKRIPYWIDYTKLTVNGKTIFDKITPAWHDQPYVYFINAKANEEIKVQFEWLPHRGDILPDKPVEKSLVDKFLPYVTSRIDVKLQSTAGDFKIISMSDNKASVKKPTWLQRDGVGYTIQSYAGKMEFVAKTTADGKINLNLLGLDVRDPKDNSKRIPYWIDYTKLTVNGKSIIDKITPAWHDKIYYHNIDAKANEEIKIQVEWLPHIADIDKDFSTEYEIYQNKFPYIEENLTAISVIIPMYNAQKYIAECLDSLLAQTFKDFEVIVVDDCSTDNSVKIVESYASKFDGRLKIASMEKNSGGCAMPRNKGMLLSRGEYIQFLDTDDTLTKTALEEMYNHAKKHDADVVYCEKYFMSSGIGEEFVKNIHIADKLTQQPPFVDKPTLETEDLSERIEKTLDYKFWVTAWVKFVKRNLLLKNEIFFPYIAPGEDDIWTYGLIFFAKKFLRVPNMIYIHRMSENSVTRTKRTPKQAMNFHLNPFLLGLKSLDNLMAKHEFFKKNPQKRYAILKRFFNDTITAGFNDAAQLSVDEVYETIKGEFSDRLGDYDVPISALCSALFREKNTSAISKFRNYITGRVDFKFWSTEGDFELLSVSDDKAEVLKPDWFQNGGVGYVIMSYAGKVEFVAKATANGRVSFEFRGMWAQDPEDNSKLTPYWIDYTKLTVNGQTIIDKITPAWHDQPYVYTMDAKADEEIKVQFEWLPHRDDILPDKSVEKPSVDKFPPYVTSRMDVKLQSTKGDFQILSMSDNQAEVIKPAWLQKGGVGYQIQSYAGKMEFVAKATADGKINLDLMGMDVRDPKDNSKRIPNWIDYTKLTVNGKTIIDKITPAWHDKPYNHSMDVKAGEEIKIQVEWLPHREDILPDKSVEKPPVDKFPPYVTSRMDVKLQSTKGDFQILSVSDDNAEVIKPVWFQKNGVGYQIQSYAGKMEFIARATADGKINLNLLGMDVRDPKDNSKRVPNWIDYTKLTINGKSIIDKITPAWHDKPYNHSVDAKAGEEIKIQVEWLPHRDDILPDKSVEKPPVDKFPPYVTSRMDVKLQSTKGDFQILSVSDDNAEVIKPVWFQKNGVGYQIQSYAGKMEFIARATADGKINLNLLGMDVRDPKDNSKRVPNWIDYTKLTINGKSIIDKLTPAWHDKPYVYTMDAKADEEIKIQVEWLPHRDDILPDKPVEKPPVDKFPPYVTSRMDVKLQSTKGDFQILSMSDNQAEVLKPAWFQKGGVGYQIQSHAGKMEFVAKATADGKINLNLLGMDVRDPKDNSKRVPNWIDYTKLTINGKSIIDKITPAWHDKPYNHSVDVKAGEEIKIQVEWLPHRSDILPDKPVEKPPVDKFPPNITSRMDVKLQSTKGDFQILSVSDNQAEVIKPAWFQKDGVGYQIQSHAGKMEFVAKATVDGKIDLVLRGLDIHDSKDNSKRIPYWIDYTKLTINGKSIIDKITPAWHDKPYNYNMDVKAGEEIKIQVEWLPHRSDT